MAKKINIAINGFGRIGRAVFKIAYNNKRINIVAINDLSNVSTNAQLLKRDTVYGEWGNKVSYTNKYIKVNNEKIPFFAQKDPSNLPWADLKVDLVLDCTGKFLTEKKAALHIKAGAKKVLISAPEKGGDIKTIVIGVNENKISKKDILFSNASCTTNCVAPIMKVLCDNFGVSKSMMTTIHAYTASQNLVDSSHKDMRRARAAALNMIPTTTGAALATTKVIPELKNKFDGLALRIPLAVGSLSDLTVLLKKKTTVEEVNKLFEKISKMKKYKGIIGINKEPLVSSDFIGHNCSTVVDLSFTRLMGGNFLKLFAWYDNEWGYSVRLVDLALKIF